MGPNITKVDQASQATPFAQDFLGALQGYLSSLKTGAPGPLQQQGVGASGQQYDNGLAQLFGGVNTAAGVKNYTPQLIDATTNVSNRQTDRNAAQIRESFGASGNRLGTSRARVEGQYRNEAGDTLAQTIASILMAQNQAETQARQFDVGANQAAFGTYANIAGAGILPQEIIATPSIGSQIVNGLISGAAAYLGGGGAIPGLGGGGAGSMPTGFGGMPARGGGFNSLPPTGRINI